MCGSKGVQEDVYNWNEQAQMRSKDRLLSSPMVNAFIFFMDMIRSIPKYLNQKEWDWKFLLEPMRLRSSVTPLQRKESGSNLTQASLH